MSGNPNSFMYVPPGYGSPKAGTYTPPSYNKGYGPNANVGEGSFWNQPGAGYGSPAAGTYTPASYGDSFFGGTGGVGNSISDFFNSLSTGVKTILFVGIGIIVLSYVDKYSASKD